jgi:hypothetical protein
MRGRGDFETSGSGEYQYHYNREERLAKSPRLRDCYSEEGKSRGFFGGIFRRNRGLMFLLADVILLVLVFVIYMFLTSTGDDRWRKNGYTFLLTAFAYEDKAFISLKITRGEAPSGTMPEVHIRLWLEENNAESPVPELPVQKGEVRFVRTVFPRNAALQAFAEISIGGEKKILSAGIKKE